MKKQTTISSLLHVVIVTFLLLILTQQHRAGGGGGGTPAVVDAARTVQFIQLVHRHGARTPILSDESLQKSLCGGIGHCGQLNIFGEAMLRALGDYLRDRYVLNNESSSNNNKSTTTVPPSPHFAQEFADNFENYNHFRMHDRSTDIDRTLQSSGAMLRGLFPNLTSFYPIIHTIPIAKDTMLMPEVVTNFAFSHAATLWAPLLDPDLPYGALLNQSIAMKMAQEAGFPASACNSADWPTSESDQGEKAHSAFLGCTLDMQDFAKSFQAMGVLTAEKYPTVIQYFEDLNRVSIWNMGKNYQFLPDKYPNQKNSGALSYELGQKMFENADAQFSLLLSSSSGSSSSRLGPGGKLIFEFSGHDITVAPFWALLGHNEMMYPQFGEVAIVEFILDDETNETFVDLYSGRPGTNVPPPNLDASHFLLKNNNNKLHDLSSKVIPSEHYKYTMKRVFVPCKSASGVVTNVTDGSCPYEDFKRFVLDHGKPANPAGYCYLEPVLFNAIGCNDVVNGNKHPYCASYRKQCPLFGCPFGYAVDLFDYGCVSLVSPTTQTCPSSSQNSSSSSTTELAPTTTTPGDASSSTTTSTVVPASTTSSPTAAATTTTTEAPPSSSSSSPSSNSSSASDDGKKDYTKTQLIEYAGGSGAGGLVLGLLLGWLLSRRPAGSGQHHLDNAELVTEGDNDDPYRIHSA